MVVVLLVAGSMEPASEGGQLASSRDVLSSGEILPDEEVFHKRESCPLENFYVSHFVLPSDLHDWPQMSLHESV